jgi:hypothetical protein
MGGAGMTATEGLTDPVSIGFFLTVIPPEQYQINVLYD